MKRIPLLLMGCGGVGRQLLDHIVSCRTLHSKQGLALRVVGVCDSRSLLVVNDVTRTELSDDFLTEICRAKSSGSSLSALSAFGPCQIFQNSAATRQIVDIAGVLGRSNGLAVVDCSASTETVEILKQVVDFDCCIVLANKKPITSDMEDYEKLISNFRRIRYESTVGAGLPVIASITRVLSSGDSINRIVGSLSGTLGYVMSELEDGKLFSEVVLAAKNLGYTEPDPRDDLSGMDVARKGRLKDGREVADKKLSGGSRQGTKEFMNEAMLLSRVQRRRVATKPSSAASSAEENRKWVGRAWSGGKRQEEGLVGRGERTRNGCFGHFPSQALILARLLGWKINMNSVKVESLYPDKMGPHSMSTEEFLRGGLASLDKEIAERVRVASVKGNVLRYVCMIEDSRCWVGLQELPKESPLGRLRGSDNVVEIYSRCYKELPLVIQGAGAGNDTTAAGVLADIIDLQDLFN